MIKKITTPLSVGLALIAGVFGFFYMMDVIKGETFSTNTTYGVWAPFEDASGLAVSSSVSMAGIPVGRIERIALEQEGEAVVARVFLRISNDVALYSGIPGEGPGPIKGGAVVVRKQSSILGDYFLSILPGHAGEPLVDGDQVPNVVGKSGMDLLMDQFGQMESLTPKLEKIITNLEEVSEGIAIAMGGKTGGQRLAKIVENVGLISDELVATSKDIRRISAEIDRIVKDGTVGDIAKDLRQTSKTASNIAERIDKLVSAGEVERLVKSMADTSENVALLGQDLQKLVETGITPRIAQLDRMFRNFEKFSANIASLSDAGGKVLMASLDNFKTISDEALAVIGRSKGDVESSIGTLKGTLAAAQVSIVKLSEVLDDVHALTSDLRQGRGTVGRLLTDDKLIDQIEQVVEDTSNFVKQYTLMQTHVEMSSVWFMNQDAGKNVFELRFQPKEDKYYRFQLVDDPRGTTKDITRITQTNDPNKPSVLKEQSTETSHNLKFTFQFAKQWYFLVGRFGITENTGGLGLDFTFFKDRLQFQFDLFDFAMNNNPRLRGQVQYEVIRHVFLTAGADDMMNPNMRDYYLGAGLRFTDDDLRSLIMAAPSISP